MGKFQCECGHSIPMSGDDNRRLGRIIKDQDFDPLRTLQQDMIGDLMEAMRAGDVTTWERKYAPWKSHDQGHRDVSYILAATMRKFTVEIIECEECGRLHIQEGVDSGEYRTYMPTERKATQILESEHYRRANGGESPANA